MIGELNIRQQKFCQEYIKSGNATDAYIKAGYNAKNEKTVGVCATKLLRNASVSAYIAELRHKLEKPSIMTAQEIRERLTKFGRQEATEEVIVVEGLGNGESAAVIKEKHVSARDATAAIKELAKINGLYDNPTNGEKEKTAVNYLDRPEILMGSAFFQLHNDVVNHNHTFYWLKGGRGSLKSSFISLEIVRGICKDETHQANAIIYRRYSNDLKESVYNQIQWAIDVLGVGDDWEPKLSPMKFIYKPTGQEIVFRGLDKPKKSKSGKPQKGYFAYIWYEELDEYRSPSDISTSLISAMRGGEKFWVFYSFNPPESINNWVNYESTISRADKIVHHSDYRSAPPQWLGEPFIREAEHLAATNPEEYNHTYLGIATGTGGEVFKNVHKRTITDDEIKSFDHIRRGLDYGQVVDPMAYVVCNFARRKLYIFAEFYKSGASLRQTAAAIKAENKLNDQVRCDSAEKRSTKELRDDYDINAVNARKGAGSVERGIRFLAKDIDEIIIDGDRCPNTLREFTCYELKKDKAGNLRNDYPDENNHSIDAVRYALENDMDNAKGIKGGNVDIGG